MGKSGKKPQRGTTARSRGSRHAGDGEDILPYHAYDLRASLPDVEEEDIGGDDNGLPEETGSFSPSKFELYQRSVQSPKGDISYLQKFFLMYVGGRAPLHLQEDFCGTAFLSSEWLRGDPRRTAIGLDLDLEALSWCLENNLAKTGADLSSRISLFHGNVLQPLEAHLVYRAEGEVKDKDPSGEASLKSTNPNADNDSGGKMCLPRSAMKHAVLPSRDIVCAFNYSCCCLLRRTDLVLYFKHALNALTKSGGIFVMDLYGGISSECKLQLQRRFSNFTYEWEQEEFDTINRRTKISLHFRLGKKHIIRHAFSYDWRLWSLPEIKDCMEEAGFRSVHFWIREMPTTGETENKMEYTASRDAKYEELSFLPQQDSWNAYIVGVR